MGIRSKIAGVFLGLGLLGVALAAVSPAPSLASSSVDIVVVGGPAAVSDEIVTLLGSCTNGEVRRLEGPNRFATAAAVSKDTFPTPGVPVAFITRADIYPDALSSVPKASIVGGPILLVNPTGTINGSTAAELSRLKPQSIIVLGGTAAVSDSVKTALESYTTGAVTRIGGSNRYGTSALLSASQFAPDVDVAYVASGDNFPDAMVTGVLAALGDAPVLLTRPTGVPGEIQAELTRLKPKNIVVVGGTAILPDSIMTALDPFTTGSVTRIAGPNRYATAADVSMTAFPDPAVVDRIYIGTGVTFADVLPAGVAAAQNDAPLLLVAPSGVPTPTADEILRLTGKSCAGSVNHAPVATNDAYSTDEDVPLTTGSVLTNDTDVDGNALSVSAHDNTSSAGGTVADNGDGTFDYVPPADYSGSDSFEYTVTDGTLTDVATVTVTVNPINDDPVAGDDAFETDEDVPFTTASVLTNDSDVDGGTLSVSDSDAVSANGATVVDNGDGTFDYTPVADYNGTDTFGYEVSDGNGGSDTATVTVTVNPINDDPVAVDDYEETDEDTLLTTANVLTNDLDIDGDTVSVSSVDPTSVEGGTVTDNGDGTFDYTPALNFNGVDSFAYSVTDGNGGSASANVHVTVNSVNDAPVANNDAATVGEGGTVTVLDSAETTVQANDTDVEDGTPGGLVSLVSPPSNGSITLLGNGTFSYTHDGSETTTDSFTYLVDDNDGEPSNAATVNITIVGDNDAPVANDDAIVVDEDGIATSLDPSGSDVRANDTDAEDGTPSGDVTLVGDVSNGSLTLNADGTFSYTHDGSETTSDAFTYTVKDSVGLVSNIATVNITVTPVNDDPVANDDAISVAEGGTATSLVSAETTVQANDTDAEDGTPTGDVTLVGDVSNGSLTLNADGTFSYTHDGSETISDFFTYTVEDADTAVSNTATVNITVTPVNDDPVANDDAISVAEGGTATSLVSAETTVQANDTDAEDGTPTGDVTLVTDATNGSLTLNADGTFSYTHDGSETISDFFTYTVEDADNAVSNTATVNITITPVNDDPVAGDSSESTDEDTVLEDAVFNASDAEDAAGDLTYGINQPGLGGVVTDNGDGTYDFDPNGDFDYLEDGESINVEFTYSVTDTDFGTSAADGTVTVTVTGVNDSDPLVITKSVEAREVLYRVNSGGAVVPATDGGPDWSIDTPGTPSPWINAGYTAHESATKNTGGALDLTGVPVEAQIDALFTVERWDDAGGDEMGYTFPVDVGDVVEVRLYFAEVWTGVDEPGDRTFDVLVEGAPLLNDFDQWVASGNTNNIGLMESTTVTSDGAINIDFVHEVQNPAIKAIEIIRIGTSLPEPGGVFTYTATIENPVSNTEAITVTTVTDSLAGDVTPFCETPLVLSPGDSIDCVFDQTHTGEGDYLDTVTAAATANTSGETASATSNEVTATVTNVPGLASAEVGITEGSGIAASTYTGGSLTIENTSVGRDILSVSIDIGKGLFPDAVFDPNGTAGDATGKCFTADSGAVATGLVTPSVGPDACTVPFSSPHNGDPLDGYDVITIDFADFNPGETFTFSVDIDPNNIKNAPSTGAAGAVSGLELAGAEVTVEYSDASIFTTSTWRDTTDSAGGGLAIVTDPIPGTPTIDGVVGVPVGTIGVERLGATVTDPAQSVTVSGPAGADVELLVVEGGLTTGAAYMVEEFDANEALSAANITVYNAVIGGGGTVDIPVTLTNTAPFGGYNMITAAIIESGRAGLASNDLVLLLSEDASDTGLAAGATVTTDGDADGAFDYDPIEVTVQVPSAGTYDVDIVEGPVTTSSPYTLLGLEVDLTFSGAAPAAADPYSITFELDASLTAGATTTDVFKDGILVPACLAGGTADPDPCVESVTTDGDGDLVITVLSTTASAWNFANDVPPNDPPAFDQDTGDQANDEGDVVSIPSPATDPDAGPLALAYSATGLPSGVTMDAGTGLISGTIDAGAAALSPYSVELTVTDGVDADIDTFTWTVTGPPAVEALYRINVGGPELAAADASLPVWAEDSAGSASAYRSGGGTNLYQLGSGGSHPGPITTDGSVPPATPTQLFATERWDGSGAPEMAWAFPVPTGQYEVRLFFAELYGGVTAANQRLFDVSVEGSVPAVFDDIDQFDTAGATGGFMLGTTVIVSDGTLDLEFLHIATKDNPALKGIEIIPIDGLVASPESHDFGAVEVGATGSQSFTIANVGTVSVETTSITVIGDAAFSLASIPSYPNNIAPGEDYTIEVDFDPTSPGLAAAYVEIVNTETTLNIALIGEGTSTGSTVLYRVNAHGPAVTAIDGGPDWESDDGASSSYREAGTPATGANGSTNNTFAPAPYTPAASTPNTIFGREAYGETEWKFPVAAGTPVEVRLFLQESWPNIGTGGPRVFDVQIDGVTVFDDINLNVTHGFEVATMYTHSMTADADGIDIDFIAGQQNPLINGFEIVTSAPQPDVLGIAPLAYDFGSVIFGGSESTSVTLTNLGDTGDPSITIGAGDVSLDNAEFDHDFSGPVVLAPGESYFFDVMFNPVDAGPETTTLTVVHTGTNSPTTASFDGDGTSTATPGFTDSNLAGYASSNPTSLQFGPDSRLYVSDRYGTIRAYTVVRNGQDDYEATAVEVIDDIQDIVNHNDTDGSVDGGKTTRQVTGLLVAGTPTTPVLYVTSSDPQVVTNGDSGLDTNSGTLSRLTKNGSGWDHVHLVRGLPRSEENHATNGMALDESDNTLYIIQGGHTNMGAPNSDFSATPEYALSAALLSVDLDAIDAMTTQTDGQGQDYKYNLPTIDDPTRPNTGNTYTINGQTVNEDVGDPFGGNDGLNQAAWILGGPVEVYSPGYRNAYDVVLTQAGRLYTFDNGPNGGWGGLPVGEGPGGTCTNEFNESGDQGLGDGLYFISGPGYYGGHPNPVRANPTGAGLYVYGSSSPWSLISSYDFGTDPGDLAYPVDPSVANAVECDYINPNGHALAVINSSTNGLDEYTATNFGGAMTGDLLAAAHNGTVYQFAMNAAGDAVSAQSNFASPGSTPLDVTTQSDTEIFPGTVWVAQFGGGVKVYEPTDYDGSGTHCVGGPGAIDEDGDGYTNDDEIDNGTNECSAADKPSDFDGDNVSDLNDPDDDDDFILDEDDAFAIDPDNGSTTPLPEFCGPDNTPSTDTCLHFLSGDRSGTILELGFTGLMANGSTNWLDQYDEEKLIVGGVIEALGLEDVPPGDAHQATNSQLNGFQFGFDPGSDPFVLHTKVLNPLSDTPDQYMSAGFQFGPGDQDNYVKLVVGALGNGAGGGGLQLATEVGGSFTGSPTTSDPNVEGQKAIDLWLTIDPASGQVDATYAIDGGTVLSAGSTTVPVGWFSSPVGVGLISTSTGASPFDVTWALLEAWQPAVVTGTPEAQIDVSGNSTFGNDTMQIANTSTGNVEITNVSFDLSTVFLPDVVFDPTDGTPAGDTAGKCLDINTEGGTGFDDSGDECVDPFSSPHQNGYYVMDMAFNDFDPGETVGFSIDIDPTSIFGHVGSSDAGSIGGFELTGATVTVDFSDGSSYTGTMIGDGAGDDSSATVRAGLPGAPTAISAVAVAPVPTIVGTSAHTIRVEGPVGAEVALFGVEAALLIPTSDIDPFEANKALSQDKQTDTIGVDGYVDFSVTLLDTQSDGALNHFIAVLTDSGDAGSAPSDTIVLEYEDAAAGTVVQRVNAGGSAIGDTPNWEADTAGANHPALVGPGDNKTGSFDGAHGPTVPASTPLEVWDTERYTSNGTDLDWSFSVTSNSVVLVRLYLNNGYSGTQAPGTRLFDISVEGQLIVADLDLSGTFGHQTGGVVTVRVDSADTADGLVAFSIQKATPENPLINAIEIIEMP